MTDTINTHPVDKSKFTTVIDDATGVTHYFPLDATTDEMSAAMDAGNEVGPGLTAADSSSFGLGPKAAAARDAALQWLEWASKQGGGLSHEDSIKLGVPPSALAGLFRQDPGGGGRSANEMSTLTGITPEQQGDELGAAYQNALRFHQGSVQNFSEAHPVQATTASIAGQLPAVATGLGAEEAALQRIPAIGRFITGGGGRAATGEALPGVNAALTRLLSKITGGTIQGATVGALPNSNNEGNGKDIAEGAGVGALLGGVAGPVLGSLSHTIKGSAIDPAKAALARWAGENGVNVLPWQLSNNELFKSLSRFVGSIPGSGRSGQLDQQLGDFTSGVAHTVDPNLNTLNAQDVGAARRNIGAQLDDQALRTGVRMGWPFLNGLNTTMHNLRNMVTDPGDYRKVARVGANILDHFRQQGGALTGEQYQAFTGKGGDLDQLMNDPNNHVARAAQALRDHLQNAFETSSPGNIVPELKARWKAGKTLEKIGEKNQPTGQISPQQMGPLLTQVLKRNPNYAVGGGGPLAQWAKVGTNFLNDPGLQVRPTQATDILKILTGATLGVAANGANRVLSRPSITRELIARGLGERPPGMGLPFRLALPPSVQGQQGTRDASAQ